MNQQTTSFESSKTIYFSYSFIDIQILTIDHNLLHPVIFTCISRYMIAIKNRVAISKLRSSRKITWLYLSKLLSKYIQHLTTHEYKLSYLRNFANKAIRCRMTWRCAKTDMARKKTKVSQIANHRTIIHTSILRAHEWCTYTRMKCRNLKLVKPQTTQAFVRRPIDIQREILNGIKLVLMRVRRARWSAVSAALIRIP